MTVLTGGGHGAIQARGQRHSDGRGWRFRPGSALEGDSTPVTDADQLHGAAVLQVENGFVICSDCFRATIKLLRKIDCHTITPFSMIVPPYFFTYLVVASVLICVVRTNAGPPTDVSPAETAHTFPLPRRSLI